MNTVKFEMEFNKLDGFAESDFISVVNNNLKDVHAKYLRYKPTDAGYQFEVDFVQPNIPFQAIMGCFSGIERDYPMIENVGMPIDTFEFLQSK